MPPECRLGQGAQVVVEREARAGQDARPHLMPVAPPAATTSHTRTMASFDMTRQRAAEKHKRANKRSKNGPIIPGEQTFKEHSTDVRVKIRGEEY